MCRKQDIFTATKTLFWLGKILGSITYSVKGSPKTRKLKVTCLDVIISLLQIFIISIFLILYYIQLHNYPVDNFASFTVYILFSSYFCLVPTVLYFGLGKRKQICEIWNRIDHFCFVLEDFNAFVDYKFIRKNCDGFIIFVLIVNALYFLCDIFLLPNDRIIVICYTICSIIAIFMECQMIIILFILSLLIQCLNELILNSIVIEFIKVTSYIKVMMFHHFELYEICKIVDRAFNFLIVRIYLSFVALLFSPFITVVYINNNKFTFVLIMDVVLWNLSNLANIFLIVFFCDSVKKKVKILYL